MDSADDAELLRRAADGDDAAAAILVRRYVRPVTLFAARLVGDVDDAEDVVADAFVIALDRAATMGGKEADMRRALGLPPGLIERNGKLGKGAKSVKTKAADGGARATRGRRTR